MQTGCNCICHKVGGVNHMVACCDKPPYLEPKEHGTPQPETKEAVKVEPDEININIDSAMHVQLIQHMGDDKDVMLAAKVSTIGNRVLDQHQGDNLEGFLSFLMKNRHGTPFEHNAFTFFVSAPIAVFREFHRHRIGFSYNEMSGRYTKLPPTFYIPPMHRPLTQIGKPGQYEYIQGDEYTRPILVQKMKTSFEQSYRTYQELLESGVAKEVARGVLPVYLYSSMYVTCNARSLMSFLSLRTKDPESAYKSFPMWEIEQVAQKMERLWAQQMPVTASLFRSFGSVAP